MARFRFAEQDWPVYGDRWHMVDVFRPADIDAGILEEWEEATGFLLFGDFTDRLQSRSIKALRAMCWLAYLIGGGTIDWSEFKPQVHLIEWDYEKAGEPRGEAPGPNRATRRATQTRSKAVPSANTSTTTTSD